MKKGMKKAEGFICTDQKMFKEHGVAHQHQINLDIKMEASKEIDKALESLGKKLKKILEKYNQHFIRSHEKDIEEIVRYFAYRVFEEERPRKEHYDFYEKSVWVFITNMANVIKSKSFEKFYVKKAPRGRGNA